MSLDFRLVIDPCVHCGRGDETIDYNYTHNVREMWLRAGCYDALYKSHGMRAREVLPHLVAAVDNMRDFPDTYEPLNPANGWGSYSSALAWLCEVTKSCAANPDAMIRVSR